MPYKSLYPILLSQSQQACQMLYPRRPEFKDEIMF